MVPIPSQPPRITEQSEYAYDVARLTRDLTIEDFSDIDLSDITFDDYRSSMESLTKARDKIKLKTLLPRRRAPISRSQSLRGAKSLMDSSDQLNKRHFCQPRKLVQQDSLSLGDYPIRDTNNTPDPPTDRTDRASFKELSAWGVFRPLAVDAAIVNGKILMPSHVGSFRLASRTKEQLSVDISEPLYIDANTVDIRDDWVKATSLQTGKSGLIPSLYATPIDSPPVSFSVYYVGTTSVRHHRGGSILWPGVQQVLQQRRRPIQLTVLITNEGIRLIQMTQLRKRDFVQSDHLLTYSTFIPLHLISYCGTHPTAERYFAFISRNFDPEEGCAAHAFVCQNSTLEITSAMEKAFKQGFSSQFDCDVTVDEYLE